jgi:surface protein
MATSDKLQKLLETKEQIRQAIIDKGVEVGDDVVFADYSNKIAEISGGSDNFLALRTNNHTNYGYLFQNYKGDSLEPFALDTWNTGNVTTMKSMFSICYAKDYNLGNWDFSKVTDTSNMFSYSDAVNIDLSNWTVNPELSRYNMGQMFIGCDELETLDIRNLNIAISATTGNAFFDCNKLHTLRLDNCPNDTINKIITSTGFPTGTINGVQRKIYVNPDNISDLTEPDGWIFVDSDGNEIVQEEIPLYQLDMFSGNTDIEEVSVMVTEEHNDLSYMFSGCENLRAINGINEWDTSNVILMNSMFYGCKSLESLDLSSFNTSNVDNMYEMFSECENLKELNLSNFEIREFCDTDSLLYNCVRLHTLRLDNCNKATISKIINPFAFSIGEAEDYEGTRQIFVKAKNVSGLTAPDGWEFVNVE